MEQARRDAIATAIVRRDALLAEAEVFEARGCPWDAEMRRAQAAEFEAHRVAILARGC